jgi:hypothetical protein
MLQWLQEHDTILWWLVGISVFTFIASAVSVPWMVTRIPANYFSPSAVHYPLFGDRHPVVRFILVAGKNLLGAVLVVLGALMLVLPGQGLLTILAGVVLLDLPGRRRALEWIVAHDAVLRSLNWIRHRAGHEPLVLASAAPPSTGQCVAQTGRDSGRC